jgi:hypothetical protein
LTPSVDRQLPRPAETAESQVAVVQFRSVQPRFGRLDAYACSRFAPERQSMIMPGLPCLPYVEVVEVPTTIIGHTARLARQLPYDHFPSARGVRRAASDDATGSVACSMSISTSHKVYACFRPPAGPPDHAPSTPPGSGNRRPLERHRTNRHTHQARSLRKDRLPSLSITNAPPAKDLD